MIECDVARTDDELFLVQADVDDLVPEYVGTALTFLDGGGATRATADLATTYGLLRTAFAARGVTTLAASPARNSNAVAT